MPNPNPSPSTRFKPGQTGNPGGRPKNQSVTGRLREILEEKAGKPTRVLTKRDEIALAIFEEARARDHRFIETLLDRTEGKVPQAIQLPTQDLESVRDQLSAKRQGRNADSDDTERPA